MSDDQRPLALVANDDGIGCLFLHELVAAVSKRFRVFVAAPAGEQSWIGRAFSRNRDVLVEERRVEHADKAWAIHGTPADCVNIALGHLVGRDRPAVVLSGINVGYNVSMPLGLSSGTLAAATEGAAWGHRAAAFSLDLPQEAFEHLRHNEGRAAGPTLDSLRHAAAHAAEFAHALLDQPEPEELVVHNYNFPFDCRPDTPVTRAEPADLRLRSLYEPVSDGRFRFRWNDGENLSSHEHTDLSGLARGEISHSVLNFSTLGRLHSRTGTR